MDPIIKSSLFELAVDQYERDLKRQNDYLFEIPTLLRDICKVIFIHNKQKSVKYKNIPKDTLFMDNVDKCLEYVNPIVKRETKGYFEKVDETTEMNMRNPEFRSAIIAFFYLEGSWCADSYGQKLFHNIDGTTTKNVEFIGFTGVRVIVLNGILTAHVSYVAKHNKRIHDKVCFTMPTDHEDGIYEQSLLLMPEVDLKSRIEDTNGLDTKVVCFRYLHNENGFKAVGMVSKDSADGGCEVRHVFKLDRPFTIEIYYKSEKMVHVRVENLNE